MDGDARFGSEVGTDGQVFAFERTSSGEWMCMPMIARLKLDRCGIKLSRKQWRRMDPDTHRRLCTLPCDTIDEVDAYGAAVAGLLDILGERPAHFQIDLQPLWEQQNEPPQQVRLFTEEEGLPPPSREAWAQLTPLQRFALVKLTRHGRRNASLADAVREFGLLS